MVSAVLTLKKVYSVSDILCLCLDFSLYFFVRPLVLGLGLFEFILILLLGRFFNSANFVITIHIIISIFVGIFAN